MKKNKLLYTSSEWSVEDIDRTWKAIDKIAKEEYGLDYYDPQIEIITYDQMLDAYSHIGMPISYKHWSFGKSFLMNERAYKRGEQGLAYELVINSNPAIAYIMESNSMTMQALVMAHACVGHVHFFKNNYLFKQWTDADGLLTYLKYSKKYVAECIEKYGEDKVETLLDSCHALQEYGVDTYKRSKKKTHEEKLSKEIERLKYKENRYSSEYMTVPGFHMRDRQRQILDILDDAFRKAEDIYPEIYEWSRGFPEENILLFMEKRSPFLYNWEREIIRIVRNMAQYFYPQRQTKVMNEGFATAMHYTLMHDLFDRGLISDGNILEFLHSHTGVCCQHPLSNINPYALGFNMFMDLKRICENPTEEDYTWFPDLAGSKDWLSVWKDCVANYRDESFILQFLSPKVIRDMKLASLNFNSDIDDRFYTVTQTHREEDILELRKNLARQHTIEYYRPNIQIVGVEWLSRELQLELEPELNGLDKHYRQLDTASKEKMHNMLDRLWPSSLIRVHS